MQLGWGECVCVREYACACACAHACVYAGGFWRVSVCASVHVCKCVIVQHVCVGDGSRCAVSLKLPFYKNMKVVVMISPAEGRT